MSGDFMRELDEGIWMQINSTVDQSLSQRMQDVLNEYRPILYKDGGDVEVIKIDDAGIVHLKMFGACIDCPISLLTMKLGIKRLLMEHFTEVTGVHAITDVTLQDFVKRTQ